MEPGLVLVFAIGVVIVVRLVAGSLDGDRIDRYVRERGGRVISRHWSPFGRGWFGERGDRIYELDYEDRHGDRRRATVKTSMFSGVYLTEDRIVRRTSVEPIARDELSEVERLRAENARLKAELTKRG